MSEREEHLRWPGHVVGLGLYFLLGLPASALFVLGERTCDMGIGPPCAISWGAQKLLFAAIVAALCASIGWATNRIINWFKFVRNRTGEWPLSTHLLDPARALVRI